MIRSCTARPSSPLPLPQNIGKLCASSMPGGPAWTLCQSHAIMSESAAALASSHAEQGEKTIEDVTSKMGMDQEQEADQDAKKQELMAAVLKSLGEKLDFDNEAKFINGRAALADGHAKNVLETAARHRSEVSLTERAREGGRGRVCAREVT